MKKLLSLTFGLVALLAAAAFAGDYHSGQTLNCAECHIMHGSQAHGYNSNGGGNVVNIGGAAPYKYLLRNHINELCLECHDGQTFAPDVLAANGGTTPTNGRMGGALNRDNVAPYFDATGHTLGSTDVAPGGTWTAPTADGLECTHCHTQHGRTGSGGVGIYRNANIFLNGTPSPLMMTYAIGTNDLTKDVFERSATAGGDHYSPRNVDFNEPTTTQSGYGRYCKQCHTNFHGTSSDAFMRTAGAATQTEWLRHPTADANIGAVGGGHSSLSKFSGKLYRVHVMSETGVWGDWGSAIPAPVPTTLTPSCMSCHKAHGNQNAFGLIFATGNAAFGEEGDGPSYKWLCGQCHVQTPATLPAP